MRRPSRKLVIAALLAGALLFGFGVWVLLHPASVFVQPWRAQRSASSGGEVLFGPYPVEADFADLERRGVTTIISLLEPRVPYEAELLAQERARAARHGMRVLNFPMGSILGQKFGDDYVVNSRAAAQAALQADGVAYIHCYLGLHRARNVQKYLDGFARTGTYAGTNATPTAHIEDEEAAYAAYTAGDFRGSLAALARIPDKGSRLVLMEGWNLYRLREIPQARERFESVLRAEPDNVDALTGAGYTALAAGDVDRAAEAFAKAVDAGTRDVTALEGLAFARNRQGRRDEARALLQRAVALNPDNPETRQLLQKLQASPSKAEGQPDAAE